MSYTLKQKLAHASNYLSTSTRSLANIRFAVVHYTGNDCDTDEGNANYFTSPNRGASANYFIDDDSITCSVKDNRVAYAVGGGLHDTGSKYFKKGAKYYKKCTNANSISFELCDTKKDGKHTVSKKTRENAVDFIAKKMVELNIPADNLIRHFDVNGKLCPLYYVTDEDAWLQFKKDVKAKMKEINRPTVPNSPLKPGDSGKAVKNLQKLLNLILKLNLIVDGKFGDATGKAIKKFKKKYKIDNETTTYGSKCKAKMEELVKDL